MKMATSEAGKAAYELGMEICGPLGAGHRPRARRRRSGRWSHGFFMSFANTIAGGSSEIQRNIIAQRVLGLPRALTPMDFSLTDDQELLRDTARKLLDRECPPALVRAHIDDPAAYEPLWRHLREYTALGAGPATDLCLFLEQTGYVAAPGPVPRDRAVHVADRRRRRHAPGTVAFLDDPMNPFVLEADRVERIAIVGPGPTRRRRRHRPRPRPAALRRDRRLLAPRRSSSTPPTSTLDPQPLDARGARGVARPRPRVARGRDGRHRAPHLRHDARVREGAQAVRRADRLVPGDPAQARRHVARARTRDRRGAVRGDDRRRRRRRPHAARATSAKAAAGEAARRILKDGIQIHGGIGYTWEHDLHLYLRRATADEYLLGTTGWHLDRLADLLFDGRE